jgi:SAM-dependent methyltransferase
VPAYVAELWNEHGVVETNIKRLHDAGALKGCSRVLEIGPGTGRYLEQIKPATAPETYEIYEVDTFWAEYLEKTYGILRQPADGLTLASTPSESCGLVHAHFVFVYLPIVVAFGYFAEMCRVCAPGGYVVFDFFPDEVCDLPNVERWLATRDTSNWQVILPRAAILNWFEKAGVQLVDEFDGQVIVGTSRYLVLQKRPRG